MENRQQRVQVNGSFSSTKTFPLEFHKDRFLVLCSSIYIYIYINDLLLSIQDTISVITQMIRQYTHASDKNLDRVIERLENDSSTIIQWFADNFMKLNTEKCHLMVLGRNSNQQVTVNAGNSVIENTEEEKLLGVVIDKQLNFETHITKFCQKAGNKLFRPCSRFQIDGL